MGFGFGGFKFKKIFKRDSKSYLGGSDSLGEKIEERNVSGTPDWKIGPTPNRPIEERNVSGPPDWKIGPTPHRPFEGINLSGTPDWKIAPRPHRPIESNPGPYNPPGLFSNNSVNIQTSEDEKRKKKLQPQFGSVLGSGIGSSVRRSILG